MTGSGGQRLVFLPNLNAELNDAGDELRLSSATLDQAILEAASSLSRDKPLMEYLLPCWKRAVKAASSSKATSGPRMEAHEEAKRLALSYCLFSFTLPDLFE
jgi:ubiquitin conjugation factor E4 B